MAQVVVTTKTRVEAQLVTVTRVAFINHIIFKPNMVDSNTQEFSATIFVPKLDRVHHPCYVC